MAFTLDADIANALSALGGDGAEFTPPPAGDVASRRSAIEHLIAHIEAAPPPSTGIDTTDFELRTTDGATIRMRWYTRQDISNQPGPAAVYFHGGGMILGNIDLFDPPISRYVSQSGTPILAVDYRLAPEHPHPLPVEDAYAGLNWLHEHASELGVDPNRIAVAGDSAGGGIAASVAILARDLQGPGIAKQILLMPMLDDRNMVTDPNLAQFALWSWDDNRTGWEALLGKDAGGPNVPAIAAPARVTDPSGLPSAYLDVGQLDIFRDETIIYALRLGQAGVPVEFHLHAGMPHVFPGLAFDSELARRVMSDRVRAFASL